MNSNLLFTEHTSRYIVQYFNSGLKLSALPCFRIIPVSLLYPKKVIHSKLHLQSCTFVRKPADIYFKFSERQRFVFYEFNMRCLPKYVIHSSRDIFVTSHNILFPEALQIPTKYFLECSIETKWKLIFCILTPTFVSCAACIKHIT
jgi:hypothetical protein